MLLSNTKSNLYTKVKEPNAFALFLVNCLDIYETKITDQSTLKGQMKKIAFCCFSLFFLSACQRDKIDIQDTGRKIVINGLITSDSLLNVRLSKSFYYNSNQAYVGSDSLNNARVLFYSNNTCIDSLHLVSDYRPTDMDFFYHSNYWSDRTLPLPGKEYKIVVKAPGYPDATASITVPDLVKLEKLDTSRILVAPDPNFPDLSNIRFKCQISFSDPSYETNYYLISVSKISWREWWTEKLDIRINDTVFVEKGGEIIPKIIAVDLEKRPENSEVTQYITHCPECQTELVRNEGEANHYCPNFYGCPPQIIGRIQHYISRKAMDIEGLGGETVALLFKNGLVHNYADLYELKVEDILHLERMAQKSAENLVNGVQKSKEIPFESVLFALGIRFVGETVAKKLAKHYKNIDALSQATLMDLVLVDEIGERIAKSVIEFFENEENKKIIERLKSYGVQFEIVEKINPNATEKFVGKTFVVSGVFSQFSRDDLKKTIEDNGGKVGSSISAKTDFVVAGDNMGPAKLEKANKLNIPILSEEDFINKLNESE